MKYAIVEDGGKQYKAIEGGTIEVDHYPAEVGESVDLKNVLLIVDGEQVLVGTPYLKEATIKARVASQVKGPKIIVFKYRPKKRYRVKTGHRQKYTRLQIDSIELEGARKEKTAAITQETPVVKEVVLSAAKTEAKKKVAPKKAPVKSKATVTKKAATTATKSKTKQTPTSKGSKTTTKSASTKGTPKKGKTTTTKKTTKSKGTTGAKESLKER